MSELFRNDRVNGFRLRHKYSKLILKQVIESYICFSRTAIKKGGKILKDMDGQRWRSMGMRTLTFECHPVGEKLKWTV